MKSCHHHIKCATTTLLRINEEKTPEQYYLGHCNSQGSDKGV